MSRIMLLSYLISWLALGVGHAASGLAENADDSNLQAQRGVAIVDSLLSENLHDEAVKAARFLYSKFGNYPHWEYQIENRLAIALLRQGEPELALPMLENQVMNRLGDADAHRNLGACLLALGRKGRALSEYQQVVELEPRNATARLEYGQLLLDFRILGDAQEEIQIAAHLCGDCIEIQPVLARYYFAVGQPARAVAPLTRVWKETGNPLARRNLLKALLESGQDQAVLDLLMTDSPSDLPLDELQQLVAAEGRLGGTENSLLFVSLLGDGGDETQLPASAINDPLFWGQASHNLMNGGINAQALVAVDRAIGLAPKNVAFRNNRVVLLQRLHRYDEADREWKTVLTLDPAREGN